MAAKSNPKPVQKELEAAVAPKAPLPDSKDIVGDGKARIRAVVENKIGGPGYSSVVVGVSVELSCEQSDEAIRRAIDVAHNTCLSLIDDHVDHTYNQLLSAVERNYRGN